MEARKLLHGESGNTRTPLLGAIEMPGLPLDHSGSEERVGRALTRKNDKEDQDRTASAAFVARDSAAKEATEQDTTAQDALLLRLPYHRKLMEFAGSKPIAIPASPSRSRSRAHHDDSANLLEPETGGDEPLSGKARRKRKKAMKKRRTGGLNPSVMSSAISGDEDSDFQRSYFRRIDISARNSVTSSPRLNASGGTSTPVIGGISSLRRQLSSIELGSPAEERPLAQQMLRVESTQSVASQSTVASGSASDRETAMVTSYEVTLEDDFVSRDAEATGAGASASAEEESSENVHRKMTAVDFDPITCLGKGTFGTVHMVRQRATGRLYAQKMFRKASLTVRKSLIEQTKTERAILESVNRHPFVVKLYYAFQDNEKLYLILEYAQGGELFHHLSKEGMFTEDVASFYMAELVLALEHLHRTVGVIYRDLKPENCLLDADGHLLLTDFGLSKVALDDSDRSNSILGTIEYMAPEVITGQMYGREVDWWSLGALGCDLLSGNPPFTANNYAKIQEKIVKAKLQLPYFLGPDAKDLLTRLLRKEPGKRLGSRMPRDLATIKSHRFFRRLNWKQLEQRELEPPIKPLITDPVLAENFSEEFTSLALSPHQTEMPKPWEGCSDDTFGGFTYVASPTLLKGQFW